MPPQSSPQQPFVSGPSPSSQPQYDFIMNPGKPPKKGLIPGDASLPIRIGLIAGGLIVLVIIFSLFKSLVFKGPDLKSFITVAQQQQELIHLSQDPALHEGLSLSSTSKNFAVNTSTAVSSSQSDLLVYLKKNKVKVKPKDLNLKVSAATDEQLTTAASASTYESTFKEVMKDKLNTYIQTLDSTYNQTKGPKGRQLLQDEYQQAQLLLQQIDEKS